MIYMVTMSPIDVTSRQLGIPGGGLCLEVRVLWWSILHRVEGRVGRRVEILPSPVCLNCKGDVDLGEALMLQSFSSGSFCRSCFEEGFQETV